MLVTLFCALGLVAGLTVYVAGRQSLDNAAQTQARQTELAAAMLEQFWDNAKYGRMSTVGQASYLNFQFNQCCGKGFALLQDEKIMENLTGYEIVDTKPLGEPREGTVSDYRIQRLNGKYLLMQQIQVSVLDNGRLLALQDITGVYLEIRRLGGWILGINGIVFLLSGLFIFRMMRKTVRQMEELQEVSGRQELLLGALAHEMKTPLTSIIGYSDSLRRVKLSEDQQERALLHINREGRRLESLSAKMLQMLGLYNNQSIKMELCSVGKLLSQVVETASETAQRHGVFLKTEYEEFQIKMDVELMESLLLNLTDNAVHASPPGAVVVLRGIQKDGVKLLQVEDAGSGIPEQEIHRVTEAFYRIDKSRSKKNGGVGLGLALCKKIANLHHGELQIESEAGKGTVVTVSFHG